MAECLVHNQEVGGSIPPGGPKLSEVRGSQGQRKAENHAERRVCAAKLPVRKPGIGVEPPGALS